MGNTCESLINVVTINKPKVLTPWPKQAKACTKRYVVKFRCSIFTCRRRRATGG